MGEAEGMPLLLLAAATLVRKYLFPPIVLSPGLLVRQDLVSLRDFCEYLLSRLLVLLAPLHLVGVVLQRFLPVCLLDLLCTSLARHPEDLVVVLFLGTFQRCLCLLQLLSTERPTE